jgi:hypothetical protein
MATTEQERLEMHLGLRKALGENVANTLMEHLPPSGWGDVARKHDITMALDMINLRIDGVERRMDLIEKRMEMIEKRMDAIERRLGIVITVGLAIGLALLGLQVQIMLSLAG